MRARRTCSCKTPRTGARAAARSSALPWPHSRCCFPSALWRLGRFLLLLLDRVTKKLRWYLTSLVDVANVVDCWRGSTCVFRLQEEETARRRPRLVRSKTSRYSLKFNSNFIYGLRVLSLHMSFSTSRHAPPKPRISHGSFSAVSTLSC